MCAVLYSVGHSSRTMDELVALLRAHGVDSIADVRAYPGSRRHPHFARDALAAGLQNGGIDYRWFGRELGGHRKVAPDGRAADHAALPESGFRAYAAYMDEPAFREGVSALRAWAGGRTTAFLCAERDWRSCHRRHLADYLGVFGDAEVRHILDESAPLPHLLDPRARRDGSRLIYDRGHQPDLF